MNSSNKRWQPALVPALVATAVVGAAAFAYARRKCQAPLPTVAHVELPRYAGKWYEVARLPVYFEKDCQHVTAEYALRPDGRVEVVNTCRKCSLNGRIKKATAIARAVDGTNARLKVQFFWPFEGNYWILDLDEANYQYALVGEPSRKNLWLLSRQPQLAPDVQARLIARARALGFPVEKLYFTPQPLAR